MERLAEEMMRMAAEGSRMYLETHKIPVHSVNVEELLLALRSHVKAHINEALTDAQEALEHGMTAVAMATFKASMMQAGVDAAKEVMIKGEKQ